MSSGEHLITVVIPLYNKRSKIESTLKSVLDQTYRDFDVLVVDDGSTDGSPEIVKKMKDSRIRLISQENAGVSAARNHGIQEAEGRYVALLDADDIWNPDYMENMIRLIKKYPECHIFATYYDVQDSEGTKYPTILHHIPFKGEDGILENYFEVAYSSNPPISSSTVIIERDALMSIGGFPEGVTSGEDLLTWARLATQHKIAYTLRGNATCYFQDGYKIKTLQTRRHDSQDEVGEKLDDLLRHNKNVPYLRQYVAFWHKMRASVALRYDERLATIRESFLALKYYKLYFKVMPFIILALMPKFIVHEIIRRH